MKDYYNFKKFTLEYKTYVVFFKNGLFINISVLDKKGKKIIIGTNQRDK